jgi:hypothetical protein
MHAVDRVAEIAQMQRDQLGNVLLVFDDKDVAVHRGVGKGGAEHGRGLIFVFGRGGEQGLS